MKESVNTASNNSAMTEFHWQQKTWQQFLKARTQKQLPHAILLAGEEGIGKLLLAKRMAKSLICMNTASNAADACNECQSCKTYESGANPDFTQITLLEDKQQIGVDQIRALSEFLNYTRSYNTNRVVVINPVERMNINAANSLLKSLEEPTAHSIIILITAKMTQLLPTIKSRCQLFTVAAPTKDESINWLKQYQYHQQDSDQNSQIDPELLVEIAGAKPLNAIQLTQENIDSRNQFLQDLVAFIKHQMSLTEIAKKWEKQDIETLLNWQISLLQNNIKSAVNVATATTNTSSFNTALTQHLSDEEHWLLYQNLIKQKQYIHTSVNPLMFIENMIMFWTKTI